MSLTEHDLLELKEKIEEVKITVSNLQGKKEYLLQELKKKHECSSVLAAEKKILRMTKQIAELEVKIKEGLHTLEEQL